MHMFTCILFGIIQGRTSKGKLMKRKWKRNSYLDLWDKNIGSNSSILLVECVVMFIHSGKIPKHQQQMDKWSLKMSLICHRLWLVYRHNHFNMHTTTCLQAHRHTTERKTFSHNQHPYRLSHPRKNIMEHPSERDCSGKRRFLHKKGQYGFYTCHAMRSRILFVILLVVNSVPNLKCQQPLSILSFDNSKCAFLLIL